MDITPAQNRVVGTLVELIAGKLGEGRAVHPETAISSAGRLAGSLLLRSFSKPFSEPPGTVVLTQEANLKGPLLVDLMMAYLKTQNLVLNPTKLGGAASMRGAPSKLGVIQALELFQGTAMAILSNNGLTLEQGAQSAALAAGFIVRECAATIGAEIAVNVAVFGMIEGSKIVPPPRVILPDLLKPS